MLTLHYCLSLSPPPHSPLIIPPLPHSPSSPLSLTPTCPSFSHSLGTPTLLTDGDPNVAVDETHNLTLTCLLSVETDAVHSPKLVWYRNNAELVQVDGLVKFEHTFLSNEVTERDDGKNMHKFTVSLVNVTRRQAGVYECRLFHRINISHSKAAFNVSVHCEY